LVSIGLFALALSLWPRLGTEFMPPTDEGELRISIDMEPGTRLEVLDAQVRIEGIRPAQRVPELRTTVVSVGASAFRASSPATASIQAALIPLSERGRSSEEIAADLRRHLVDIPGATVRVRASQGMVIRGLGGEEGERLTVEVRGFDLALLDALSEEAARLRGKSRRDRRAPGPRGGSAPATGAH
jgi:hydrophobic/amphiphilic exporter-1 (mainly G- bacteria), HAE1 family